MANIDTATGKKQGWKQGKIDMTPMVDLGFLLISFFVFTASMTETKAMKLYMPKDGTGTEVSELNVISFVIGEGRMIAYEGKWEHALASHRVSHVIRDHAGVGRLLQAKKKSIRAGHKMVVLIRPTPEASYGDVVRILDDMVIYDADTYALVEASPGESAYMKNGQ